MKKKTTQQYLEGVYNEINRIYLTEQIEIIVKIKAMTEHLNQNSRNKFFDLVIKKLKEQSNKES